MGKKICAKCDKEFQPGESVLTAMDKPWHVGCFVCAKCKKPFTGGSMVLDGNGKPMHEDCSKEKFEDDSGTCDMCDKTLGNGEPIVELGDGSQYHQSCFKCNVCKKPFDKKSPYHVKVNGKPCHTKCADVADDVTEKIFENNKQCTKCGQTIKSGVKVVPNVGNFHAKCFVCDTCDCELSGKYFIHPKTEMPSCKPCVDKFVQKWDRNKEEREAKGKK